MQNITVLVPTITLEVCNGILDTLRIKNDKGSNFSVIFFIVNYFFALYRRGHSEWHVIVKCGSNNSTVELVTYDCLLR